MRVLLIVTKGDLGGAQKRMLDLATRLQEHDVEVTVGVGNSGDWLPSQLDEAGIPHDRFAYLSRSNPVHIIAWWLELLWYLHKYSFDLVHFNSSSALSGVLPARLDGGVNTVFTFRGLSIISPNYPAIRPLKWLYGLAFQLFLPLLDVGVFQCKHDREVAAGRGLAPERSEVIRPGIDPEAVGFLDPEPARQALMEHIDADLHDRRVIGTIGRLSPQKHYPFLLEGFAEVAAEHDDAVLVIIGGGEQRTELERRARALGIADAVRFAGPVPDAARLMNAFDVFVLPSLYEGVSMTLTEAVHAGVPILASDAGGNRETVCDTDAALFPVNDLPAFTQALDRMLTDEQARREAVPGAGCAETLLLSTSSRAYHRLYNEITAS